MNEIKEKCEKGIYKHYIPIGHGCCLASDLEILGLRDYSYPFDWVYSTLWGVELALKTKFEGYLRYEDLYQKKIARHAYKNRNYMITFFHDFNAKNSLNSQLEKVQEKYNRRIAKFYDSVKEPTLFFRYCENVEEIEKLNFDYEDLLDILKGYNSNNDLIIIIHDEISKTDTSNLKNLYFVEKDEGHTRCETPLQSNSEIHSMLLNAKYELREKNLNFYERKNLKKQEDRKSLKSRLQRKFKTYIKEKVYVHERQY